MTNPDPFPDTPTPPAALPVEAADNAAEYQTVWRQAVEVLTRAVRLTYGIPTQPIDFADFLASALVTVAANMGSVDRLTAGRPGSWEAELVERLAHGTLFGDDWTDLLAYRTEPVRVPLNVAALVDDEGPHADPPVIPHWKAVDAALAAIDPDLPDEQWDAAEAALDRITDEIDQRYAAVYLDYANRFRQAVHAHAATIEGLVRSGVTVEVVTDTDPEGELNGTVVNPSEWDEGDRVVWELWRHARQQLGLPRP